jgi:hypothetical protein
MFGFCVSFFGGKGREMSWDLHGVMARLARPITSCCRVLCFVDDAKLSHHQDFDAVVVDISSVITSSLITYLPAATLVR